MPTTGTPRMERPGASSSRAKSARTHLPSQAYTLHAVGRDYVAATEAVPWGEPSQSLDSATYRRTKRCLDIVGGLVGIVLFTPIMLIAMFLVWLEDGGPVLFRQRRVGLNGEIFVFVKIRTMVKDAEARLAEVAAMNHHADQRTFKSKDDPRMLRVGKFLRRYSIDEFPQLLNVLSGDMSLVGPRPPIPREVDLYDPEDFVRFLVKPGLTCFWQISGRGTIGFKQQVELDRKYIRESSFLTDLKIIAKTIPSMLKGDGAH